jgi:hypothetical protein
MTHPLTDRMCGDLAENLPDYNAETCMRAAADWQLEADAEWWRIALKKADFPSHAADYVVEEFKQAMRPQED